MEGEGRGLWGRGCKRCVPGLRLTSADAPYCDGEGPNSRGRGVVPRPGVSGTRRGEAGPGRTRQDRPSNQAVGARDPDYKPRSPSAGDTQARGNWALLDQVAAQRWVQKNHRSLRWRPRLRNPVWPGFVGHVYLGTGECSARADPAQTQVRNP